MLVPYFLFSHSLHKGREWNTRGSWPLLLHPLGARVPLRSLESSPGAQHRRLLLCSSPTHPQTTLRRQTGRGNSTDPGQPLLPVLCRCLTWGPVLDPSLWSPVPLLLQGCWRNSQGLQWAYQNTSCVTGKANRVTKLKLSPSWNFPTFAFIRCWFHLLLTSEAELSRLKSSMQWMWFIFFWNQWLLRKYIVFHLFRRIIKHGEALMPSY